ncbi:type I-C CRISPR-associated protein Cas5c [Nocardia sp. NPDC051990]|uniref:type I-C CRISPR-associated protein Cas5c n=1 Tax=Nocardia sp. NPDC051990 TaxID=3155285 RepID=UPI0034123116
MRCKLFDRPVLLAMGAVSVGGVRHDSASCRLSTPAISFGKFPIPPRRSWRYSDLRCTGGSSGDLHEFHGSGLDSVLSRMRSAGRGVVSVSLVVQVWGSGALFTRPELTAERVSYPVMTPTAAAGVLEAIYWKPEFAYRIKRIEVLKEIRNFALRRNETTDLASLADAVSGVRRVDTAARRVQRNAVCLKDVGYRIHAQIDVRPHADKLESAYRDQFRRRVARGQCFSQPYLGTREFAARFSEPDDTPPIDLTADLGVMLHSIQHAGDRKSFTWFRAALVHGVLEVPKVGLMQQPSKVS